LADAVRLRPASRPVSGFEKKIKRKKQTKNFRTWIEPTGLSSGVEKFIFLFFYSFLKNSVTKIIY
jgi:hypothetical protein